MVKILVLVAEKEKINSLPVKYKVVADLLREGQAKAITSTDIMKLAGIDSKRDVMEIIEQLINKYGRVIGASRNGEFRGYYLIASDAELKDALHSYNEQIQSMLKRHKKLIENYIENGQ